jgi:type IV pilus assembly protein PilX
MADLRIAHGGLAHTPPPAHQDGAALVIALIMLLILTILALAGINTATTELTMSGNAQFRHNAAQAAATGIETAITQIGGVATTPGAPVALASNVVVPDSSTDRYTTSARFVGDEAGLPQSSADKFIGLHYVIDSTGTSARNARDVQTQGVMIVAPSGGAGSNTFSQIGTGLP